MTLGFLDEGIDASETIGIWEALIRFKLMNDGFNYRHICATMVSGFSQNKGPEYTVQQEINSKKSSS